MMKEMGVYITNPGKSNEGEFIGDWFVPPIDWEDVKTRINLNDKYEEYAIHDWELSFGINEYSYIEDINRLCNMEEELKSIGMEESIVDIQNTFFQVLKNYMKIKMILFVTQYAMIGLMLHTILLMRVEF